ncbi:MAG: 16S rRNA (cytidine(1402)-2'-O)-methyltransferase [bacterium]|nr:16S rRNA (cytidine(1402)-2'-O)-methyltransferase [bacterium]
MSTDTGTLYVVATPIGNLGDITRRAAEILGKVDIVAAEDTRHSRKLLAALGLSPNLLSYREHNREGAGRKILQELSRGRDVAVITDAGTPGISDPGHHLVALCLREGITVTPVPGPCAATTLMSVSGIELTRFLFQGFLPPKAGARKETLLELAASGYPVVLYESPNRVMATLREIAAVMGDRKLVLGREITKMHEQFVRGTALEVAGGLQQHQIRGEVTILVEGAPPRQRHVDLVAAVKRLRKEGLSASKTAAVLAQITGEDRKEIYKMASEL